MAQDDKKRKVFKLVKASIINGPGLREMELAVTDPCPNGSRRSIKFDFEEKGCEIIPVVNVTLDGMTRVKEDPYDRLNNYLWKITGKTKISFCGHAWGNYDAIFETLDYSPIFRKGKIIFTVFEKE